MHKKDIKNFTLEKLEKAFAEIYEKPYRARQVFLWVYKRGIDDLAQMHNLPQALKDKLDKVYYVGKLRLKEHLESRDGTEKFLFELSDANFIETVLISAKERKTICLSAQVGCKFACSFCASGRNGFTRNLSPSEIISQALFLRHNLKHNITNYVLMGMGEPLDNYDNVVKALLIMNKAEGMNIAARRITVSTCGIVPAIRKLKDLKMQINLSVSLHATGDEFRNSIMPVNKKYPVRELVKACMDFIRGGGRLVTIEYILLDGRNDSLRDADALSEIAGKLRAKVNLIPYSIIPGAAFAPSTEKNKFIFAKKLAKSGIKVTVRESKGKDINAACGQLAGRHKK